MLLRQLQDFKGLIGRQFLPILNVLLSTGTESLKDVHQAILKGIVWAVTQDIDELDRIETSPTVTVTTSSSLYTEKKSIDIDLNDVRIERQSQDLTGTNGTRLRCYCYRP